MENEAEIERFTKRMHRIALSLKRVLADAKKIWPEANLYLACDSLHLMAGDSHNNDFRQSSNQSNILTSDLVIGMDGGDW